MLGTMRRNTKIILWITVIAFVGLIFLGWGLDFRLGGGPQTGIAGKINGEAIAFAEYQRAIQASFENFKKQNEADITEADRYMLTEQAWQQIIEQTLISQQVKKWKIRVTDDEVLFAIRRNPPPLLTQNPAFQTNGQFDVEKYKRALDDPQLDWRPIEEYVRATLPAQVLQELVVSTVKVSGAEIKDYFRNTQEKVAISYMLFEAIPLSASEENVTGQEIEKYYKAHTNDFMVGDEVELGFVKIEKKPSKEDEAEVRRRMESVLDELKAGTDFAQLAESYSEAPSARNGGQIGLAQVEGFSPAVIKTLETLKVGQVSGIFEDRRGLKLIRLEERKVEGGKQKVTIREIAMNVQPSEETLSKARDLAWEAHDQKNGKLKEFADSQKLTFERTGHFEEGKFIPKLLLREEAPKFAFNSAASVGEISQPYERSDSWYVLELMSKTKAHVRPLSEVQEDVRRAVITGRRKLAAEKKAYDLARRLGEGWSLEAGARDAGLQVIKIGAFNRSGYVEGVFLPPELTAAAFALDKGAAGGPVVTDRGSYIFKVDDTIPIDEQSFLSQKENLMGELMSGKQREVYARWLDDLKKSAKIKDFRLEAGRPGKAFGVF
ncbi:MAG: SurA N-terminal domain-containing protein [Candidatus Eisenbacteria bacterium]|nr:SurA N-terminal domain-containing protein [Candidatus Eisenbacteria bacterium]